VTRLARRTKQMNKTTVASWLLVIAVVVAAFVLGRATRRASGPSKKPHGMSAKGKVAVTLIAALVALVALRVGWSSFVLVAGTAAAILGRLLPLLRWWPLLRASGKGAGPKPSPFASDPPRSAKMSQAQALEVLGLKEGATPQDINHAYKRLIVKIHPDQGGTSFLARQLDEARRTLLG
jgi:hypothetical protein